MHGINQSLEASNAQIACSSLLHFEQLSSRMDLTMLSDNFHRLEILYGHNKAGPPHTGSAAPPAPTLEVRNID